MNIVLRTLTGMLAAVFGAGLFLVATTSVSASAADQNFAAKRPDGLGEVVTVDDDARDDERDDTNTNDDTSKSGTGNSNSGKDNTNSRHTGVSRDKDNSRGDLTKDRTRDGGDPTRDRSKNYTNDRSKNDTRG